VNQDADIIIVGTGLVGLSAAIAFLSLGKKVILVGVSKAELKSNQSWDERIYALTPATENWLKALGVWLYLDSSRICPINAMLLWNKGLESPLVLSESDVNLNDIGIIAENRNLMHALEVRLADFSGLVLKYAACRNIEINEQFVCLTLDDGSKNSAKLLVAADGANSFVRNALNITTKVKKYDQTAIVANFSVEKNHGNFARQWFLPHETLALLPLPERHISMVWSLPDERAEHLLALNREEMAITVQKHTQNMLGKLDIVSEVLPFPLEQVTSTQLIAKRVAIVGDAAHRVHPMAGQGVNLGFRDVIAVQKLLSKSHILQDIGDYTFLREYERARKADIISMNGLTSGLDWLFATDQSILNRLTNLGMLQLQKNVFVRKALIKQAVA
jgi:ubiquinone biosynthesis UbiH/UbiF/VisC/COQ6 family hydroxylase